MYKYILDSTNRENYFSLMQHGIIIISNYKHRINKLLLKV